MTWTYLLGWQYVALGVLIIVNVVYFQQGIMGWLRERRPRWFAASSEAPGDKALETGGKV